MCPKPRGELECGNTEWVGRSGLSPPKCRRRGLQNECSPVEGDRAVEALLLSEVPAEAYRQGAVQVRWADALQGCDSPRHRRQQQKTALRHPGVSIRCRPAVLRLTGLSDYGFQTDWRVKSLRHLRQRRRRGGASL